jgi:hypothetical protein
MIHLDEVQLIGQIGNLILVPRDLNQRLADHPFQRKKQVMVGQEFHSMRFWRKRRSGTPRL